LAICWKTCIVVPPLAGRTIEVSGVTRPDYDIIGTVKKRPGQIISRKDRLAYYLAGFVDGEGSFNVSLRKKPDYAIKWQVVLSFNVSQKDITVLEILRKTLNCGIIKTRKSDGLHLYEVTSIQDINQKIIPYFSHIGFISNTKIVNFKIFAEIANLVNEGKHRKMDTLREILVLREKLNLGKGRKRKYSIKDIFQ